MTQEPGDELADRVTALEQQQRADRRALGSLDADVADLREQRRQDVRLFRSIRDTQIEHGRRLDRIDGRLDRIDGRLDGLVSGVTELRATVNVIVDLLRRDAG